MFCTHVLQLGYKVWQDLQTPPDYHMFFAELQTQFPPITWKVLGQVRQTPPAPQDWQVAGQGEQLPPLR